MLEMSNDYIEKLSLSIVREYLVRREFTATLRSLDNESSALLRTIGCYHSRLSLGKDLFLGSYIKINKESQAPLVSMLEILIKVFIEERVYMYDEVDGLQVKPKKSIPKKPNNNFTTTHHHQIKNSTKHEPEELMKLQKDDALKLYLSTKIKESKSNRASIDQVDEIAEADLASKNRDLEECYIESAIGAGGTSGSNKSSNKKGGGGNGDFKILKTQASVPPTRPKVLFNRFVVPSPTNQASVGQNLLESKQNILAQTSLSAKENELRSEALEKAKEPELKMVDLSTEEIAAIAPKQSSPFVNRKSGATGGPRLPKPLIKYLDMNTWKELRTVVFGQRGCLPEGWVGQGFPFNHKIPFGLIQKKGGPCGVLAVVQALILRNLMFGSPYADHEDGLPVQEPILNYDASSSIVSKIASKRIPALIAALAEILWKCGTMKENPLLIPNNKEDAKSVVNLKKAVAVCFNGLGNMPIGTGSDLRIFYDLDELKVFIRANLYRFDCIGLVYSAVLSRGIQNIQDDMDFTNSPLLGQHGYCTQELMNLLAMGQGISNAFDNEFVLGDKILKGLKEQADIGFLSLFEHYDSCRVGAFLKDPKYPLWIICSESHFSLLFSNDMDLTGKHRKDEMKSFDLYYYDGLASQDKLIRLTIDIIDEPINGNNNDSSIEPEDGKESSNKLQLSQSQEEELIPPLEKCIRTKWKGAKVDWNETEPIL